MPTQTGSIDLKATSGFKNYAEGSFATQGQVSSLGTAIESNAQAISLRATKTELQSAIEGIEVGGRNLIRRSRDLPIDCYGSSGNLHTIDGTYNGCNVLKYVKSQTSSYNEVMSVSTANAGLWTVGADEDYVLSFWAKASAELQIYSYLYNGSNNSCTMAETSTGYTATPADGAAITTLGTDWQRYWVRWHFGPTTDPTIKKNLIVARMQANVTGTVWIAGPKLEKGNHDTDWSPAPEDIEGRVSTAEASITEQANAIELKANASDVYTKTATDGLITTEVNNRNAAIQEKADQITSTVSQTYTTKTEFANLSIGGTNLLGEFNRHANDSATYDHMTGTITSTATNNTANGHVYLDFWYGTSHISNILLTATGMSLGTRVSHTFTYPSGSNRLRIKFNGNKQDAGIYFTPSVNAGEEVTISFTLVSFSSDGKGNGGVISGLKLERGNKATDWSMAPEDAEGDIAKEAAQRKAQYGDCTTAAATAAKIVPISNFSLYTGATISVRFTYGNTAASPSLNVNSTGGKAVVVNGSATPSADLVKWNAYATCRFTYDGTYWRFVGSDNDVVRVNNAETAITQNAQQIELRATKTEVATAIDDIEIGTRNLLRFSRVSEANLLLVGGSRNNVSVATEDGYTCYVATGDSTSIRLWLYTDFAPALDSDTTYTYQAWVKLTTTGSTTSVPFNFTSLGHFSVQNNASSATDKTHEDVIAKRKYSPSTVNIGEWTRITITFTTNSLAGSLFGVYPKYSYGTDYTLYIRDESMKLERGNKPSAWTPAPEDLETRVSAAETTITQNSEAIELRATKAETASLASTNDNLIVYNPDPIARLSLVYTGRAATSFPLVAHEGTETAGSKGRPYVQSGNSTYLMFCPFTANHFAPGDVIRFEGTVYVSSAVNMYMRLWTYTTSYVNSFGVGSDAVAMPADTWTYVEFEVTIPESADFSSSILSLIGLSVGAGTTIRMTADSRAYRVSKSLLSAEAAIAVNADSITAKVSKNDVINQINLSTEGVTIDANRVNIAGAAIFSNYSTTSQMNSAISSAVSSAGVGGRNYILNSSGVKASGLGSTAGSHAEYQAINLGQSYMDLAEGTQVTVSFDLYMTVNTANPMLNVYNTNNDGPKCFSGTEGHGEAAGVSLYFTAAVGTVIDKRVSVTGYIRDRDNAPSLSNWLEFYSNYGTSNWFSISNLKMEKGYVATDWEPAPEDSLEREQRVYYRTANSSASGITGPTTWVTSTTTANNTWTTKRMQYDSTYKYLFTCIQRKTAGGTVTHTDILMDDTTTVIDGGNIITGSVTANKLDATNINAAHLLTVGSFSSDTQNSVLNSNVRIGGVNRLINTESPTTANPVRAAMYTDDPAVQGLTLAYADGVGTATIGSGTGEKYLRFIPPNQASCLEQMGLPLYGDYVFSGYVKTSLTNNAKLVVRVGGGPVNYSSPIYTTNLIDGSAGTSATSAIATGTNATWTRFAVRISIPESSKAVYFFLSFQVYASDNTSATTENDTFQFKRLKFEGGTNVSEWSAAPEDIEAQTNAAIGSAIDDLEIGGRNLIPSSVFTSVGISGNTRMLGPVSLGTMNTNFNANGKYIFNSFEPNTQYTLRVGAVEVPNTSSYTSATRGPVFVFHYTDGTTSPYIDFFYCQGSVTYKIFTTPEGKSVSKLTASYGNGGVDWTFHEMKLEKGVKATDYTPAFEDVEADIENAVSSIDLGARNLLHDTGDWTGWSCTAGASVSDGILTTANTSTGAFQRANGWLTPAKADVYNDSVVVSFEVKKTDATAVSNIVFQLFTTNAAYRSVISGNITEGTRFYTNLSQTGWHNTNEINSSTWTKVWYGPFTMAEKFNTSNYTEYSYLACYIGIATAVGSASFRNLKIGRGDKPTDWSPAPEDALALSQRIYYRSTSSTKPSAPASWVSEAQNNANAYSQWTTKVPPIAASTAAGQTKYPYLWTCEQRKTVCGQFSCTAVQLDDQTTVIDGGRIVTGSVTANQLNADDINANHILTVGAFKQDAAATILNENVRIGGKNLLTGLKNGTGIVAWSTRDIANVEYTAATTATSECYVTFKSMKFEPGETYTLSVWMKTNGYVNTVDMYKVHSSGGGSHQMKMIAAPGTTYQRYAWTFTCNAATEETAYIRIDNNGSSSSGTNAILYVKRPQLERGDHATDWGYAEEDLIGDIDSTYSKLLSRGEQLVINGNGFMGDNTNFSTLTFDGSVGNDTPGSFTWPAATNALVETDELIPVDATKRYMASFDIKIGNNSSITNQTKLYAFASFYDADKNPIVVQDVYHYQDSTTTLARELKNGDTVVYLTDASGWHNTTAAHQRSIILWDYTNSFGYTYPTGTYSKNHVMGCYASDSSVDRTNNTITLNSAWGGGTHAAGTPISQCSSGNTYSYFWYNVGMTTSTHGNWVYCSGIYDGVADSVYINTSGNGVNLGGKFWPGVAYVRLGFLWNYQASASAPQQQIWVTNVSLREDSATSREQTIYRSAGSSASNPGGIATWVTDVSGDQGKWTAKRPVYSSSYPVLFVATQRQSVGGYVTCTTPIKDETLTVIDGGHITTGTIDSARINTSTLTIGYTNVEGRPTKVSDLTNDSGFQNSSQVASAVSSAVNGLEVGVRNLLRYSSVSADNLSKTLASNTSYTTLVTEDGYPCYKTTGTSTQGLFYGYGKAIAPVLEANTTYIYSAWIKVTTTASDTSIAHTFTSLGHHQVYNASSTLTDKSHEDIAAERVYLPAYVPVGQWTRITEQFTTNSLAGSKFGKYVKHSLGDAYTVYVREMKLEKGNKPTDWTEAPEDIDTAAQVATNFITQIDSAGIFVSPSNQTPTTSSPGNSARITADGLTVYRSGTDVASFGASARIGANSAAHVMVTPTYLAETSPAGDNLFEVGRILDDDGYAEYVDTRPLSASTSVFALPHYGATIKGYTYNGQTGAVTIDPLTVSVNGTVTSAYTLSMVSEAGGDVIHLTLGTAAASGSVVQISYRTTASSVLSMQFGLDAQATGECSAAFGVNSIASGDGSHAEGGYYTVSGDIATYYAGGTAKGDASHAEGNATLAGGIAAHAEGMGSKALGHGSHAEGGYHVQSGNSAAHLAGGVASGNGSHAEGGGTTASGHVAHAEGWNTVASGNQSHAQGHETVAAYEDQTVIGRYNSNNSSNVFEIGNGTSSARSNALAVDWSGNLSVAGTINGFTLGAPATDSRYKTASATKTNSNNTATAITSLSLEAGVWLIYAWASFASNSTGRRVLSVHTASATINTNANTVTQPATNGAFTGLSIAALVSHATTTTYYLNTNQNSGNSGGLSVDGILRAVRIL